MYDPQTSHHNDHLRCFELWKHVFLYHYTTWNFGYSLKQIPTHNKIVSSIVSQEVNIAGKSRNKLNRLLVPGWLSSCHTGTRDRLQISHALTHAHTHTLPSLWSPCLSWLVSLRSAWLLYILSCIYVSLLVLVLILISSYGDAYTRAGYSNRLHDPDLWLCVLKKALELDKAEDRFTLQTIAFTHLRRCCRGNAVHHVWSFLTSHVALVGRSCL